MARIELDRLTVDDWRTYRDIRLEALVDAPYAFSSTHEVERTRTERDWRERLRNRTQFVVAIDGVAAGTVAGRLEAGPGVAELISMWVRPEARQHGLGSLLVQAVIDWAREQRCTVLKLWVSDGNRAAERLYARHGFVRTGETQPIRPTEPDRLEFAMARTV